jgi:hypothetical protein
MALVSSEEFDDVTLLSGESELSPSSILPTDAL